MNIWKTVCELAELIFEANLVPDLYERNLRGANSNFNSNAYIENIEKLSYGSEKKKSKNKVSNFSHVKSQLQIPSLTYFDFPYTRTYSNVGPGIMHQIFVELLRGHPHHRINFKKTKIDKEIIF